MGIRQLANEVHFEICSNAFLFAIEGLLMLQTKEDKRSNLMISIKE
jgi:hypothetical protein